MDLFDIIYALKQFRTLLGLFSPIIFTIYLIVTFGDFIRLFRFECPIVSVIFICFNIMIYFLAIFLDVILILALYECYKPEKKEVK